VTAVALIDLSAACDAVYHEIPISRLESDVDFSPLLYRGCISLDVRRLSRMLAEAPVFELLLAAFNQVTFLVLYFPASCALARRMCATGGNYIKGTQLFRQYRLNKVY